MTTIHANSAALTALREVNSINRQIAASTERVSTGNRINSARDGAALWAIAATIQSDISLSDTLIDQLAVAEAAFDAASAGLSSASDTLQDIRDNLVLARANGADRVTIQSEIDGLQATLRSTAADANIGDVEILSQSASASYNPVKSFVANVSRSGGSVTVTDFEIDVRGVALVNDNADEGILDASRTENATTDTVLDFDISALTDSAADIQTIDDLIAIVDAAMGEVTDAGATVGAMVNQVQSHSAMVETIATAREQAYASLVEVDLEEEAALQEALLVRQQLAIEALAISNSSLSTILRLFE
ncbi:flagellin N-terminal helical domain-containing protein [Acuticoccus sediminis]|uniref:flagellin N-terminal helical domain-containing protein n=1 Tax=Acuticoccus sediminis TaxID=2184697 RepID=UPI001CFE0204|nr:flagellin [Acuticoccus sediminis]